MKILQNSKNKYLIKEVADFHSSDGFVKKADFKKSKVKTNKGVEYSVFDASFVDKFEKLKRNAQIITQKDIGLIISETGINKESKIVDAGGGSGALSCFLAHICKEVTTYEIREDFVKVIKENIKLLDLKNINVKNQDIYKKIDEKDIDLITLDLPQAWDALKNCEKALKSGGFLVAYFPNILQLKQFFDEIEKNKNFLYLRTIELIKREWDLKEKVARPKFDGLGHTGFLIFCRKI